MPRQASGSTVRPSIVAPHTSLVCAFIAAAMVPTYARASGGGGFAVLRLDPVSNSKSGRPYQFSGVLADWSVPTGKVAGSPLVRSQVDPKGCSKHPKCTNCAILVQQGSCTFELKARRAAAAGARILIVASAKDGPPVGMALASRSGSGLAAPTIATVMVSKNAGRQILLALGRSELLKATCWKSDNIYGHVLSELAVAALAVSLVVFGAWHGVADLRHPGKSRASEECVAIEENNGVHFVIVGSVMLMVLFFFMKYLIYLLLFVFATGAVSTTTLLLEPLIAARFPEWREQKAWRLPRWLAEMIGAAEEHSRSDAAAELLGGALAIAFLVWRDNNSFGWMLQDTIAIMLLLTIQRSLRLPNLKVGTMLLSCTFFFDIFWVFISPAIFKKSVMIEVATGAGTGQSVPMVLKIPALGGDLPGQFKILGLGDIAIPGLLISLLLRHDLTKGASRCSGYFTWGVIGYAIGLAATFLSLYLMQHGQPALLFLVPGTLIPTFLIALRKGDFSALWHADYSPEQPPEGYDKLSDGVDKHA